ncbi:MAG: hypothetical protein COA91_03175 [Robiginitomaculum sp.]|nr:MAG: hypothetical protein COA91_03175 [Robiginitomaculum sp.]
MTHILKTIPFVFLFGSALAACETIQPEIPVVVTPPPMVETCVRMNTLRKVEIPAVTKSGFSIVSIETEDELYFDPETKKWVTIEIPPIERKEPWTKIIKPAQTIFVDGNNREVIDICELNAANTTTGSSLR